MSEEQLTRTGGSTERCGGELPLIVRPPPFEEDETPARPKAAASPAQLCYQHLQKNKGCDFLADLTTVGSSEVKPKVSWELT